MGIDLSPLNNALGSALSVLRAFRLLRLFRLARRWHNLQRILATTGEGGSGGPLHVLVLQALPARRCVRI